MSSAFDGIQCGQKHCRKDGDNGDYDQQFDQGKGFCFVVL
jgi:hypothetical protein